MGEDIQKYIWCMTEIKLRVGVIEEFLDGKRTTPPIQTRAGANRTLISVRQQRCVFPSQTYV